MPSSTVGTIKQLVDASIEETDNSEVRYKLRTASQLVDVLQHNNEDLSEMLENADSDAELKQKLRDMGYME